MCASVATTTQQIMHVDDPCITAAAIARKRTRESKPLAVFPCALHLYDLVGADGQAPTPLHSKPVPLVVTAPPANWAWGTHLVWPDRPRSDSPSASTERSKDWRGWHWRYCLSESESIWCHSGTISVSLASESDGRASLFGRASL